jgi:ornithine cyclodeaminase/alanine dehydrogenase-like protein (mu-crystallin family)
MIILDQKQILESVTLNEVMDSVEEALRTYESGNFEMPLRMVVPLGNENKLLLMPCMAQSKFSTKVITLFPNNRDKGMPTIDGLVLYNCPETGKVLAIMDGKTITALRTAAVTGVSIRHLADEQYSSVGLIGCGVQGYYQLLFAAAATRIERVNLFDTFNNRLEDFKKKLHEQLPEVEIKVATSADEVVLDSEIVITATTSTKPVISDNPSLFINKHLVAIGSYQPHVRELPDAVFNIVEQVYLDTEMALKESGEVIIPLEKGLIKKEQMKNLGSVIVKKEKPDRGKHGTTLMKSVGMALFDLMTAQLVYKNAEKKKLGTVVNI